MSITPEPNRVTSADIRARKGGEPIVALTSYHAHTAAILDGAVDFILVGDSLGMVMHGFKNTIPVTLDMMILQGQAVMRGSKTALVVVDLPFGSYEESPEAAFRSAARVMKETGCGAVKLEGGRRMAETIGFLTERGVPVMGHVGLTPQSINTLGGFKVQGKSKDGADDIAADAKAVADAGAFAMVLEGVVEPLAKRISKEVPIPVIGIGASPRIATARSWFWKICSASARTCRNSSSATGRWPITSPRQSPTMPTMSGPGGSPTRITPTSPPADRDAFARRFGRS